MGTDIAEVERVRAAIERHGESFLLRVFTASEIAYCEKHRNKFERHAGRFAPKEAAMKALGACCLGAGRLHHIQLPRRRSAKPTRDRRAAAALTRPQIARSP